MSQYHALLGNTSTLKGNIIYTISEGNVKPGEDVVVYDKYTNSYKGLRGASYDASSFNTDRYSTNYDVILGVTNGVCHAVAPDDAYGYTDMVTDDTAAAPCYYRIELDNTKSGSFHYRLYSHDVQEGDVSWNANDSLNSILSQITVPSYSGKAVLSDEHGIGVFLGGYSYNTCTLTNITGTVSVIDMSQYAVYNQGVKYNDNYDNTLPVINSDFKNWRGVSVQTILGSSLIPIAPNASLICNTGQNYSYRSGANFTGWKSWATTNGSTTFVSDGVNGSTNSSAGQVMSKTAFDAYVTSSYDSTTNNGKMYEYYNNLLNSSTTDYKLLHETYESQYGTMDTLYDAYLMSHMILTDNPDSGITYTGLNKGRTLTSVKGKVFTVTYDYKYYPAYPPEYNALQYGSTADTNFGKGKYSQAETYDLGLIFRDDIISKCNSTWAKFNISKKTNLTNSMYRGSCVEYLGNFTWSFDGTPRCIHHNYRYYGLFRCRPVFAFATF